MRYFATLLLSLAFFLGAAHAWAGEWTSPKGFKITFPDNWKPLTGDQLKAALGGQQAPANGPEIVLVGPAQNNFAPQVQVMIIPQALKLDAMVEGQITSQVKASAFTAGIKIGEVKMGHVQIDKRTCFSMAYEQEAPDDPLRIWKVFIPGAKQVYAVHCVGKKSQWDTVFPDLKKILSDMRVDVTP
jgi:hypothetical protein